MNLKEYLFQSQLKAHHTQPHEWPIWDDVHSIFILYTSDWMEKNTTVHLLQKSLQQEDKSVVLWGICDKKEILSPNLPSSRILGKKHFTLLGKPKKEVLSDLQRQEYDIFLDLCSEDSLSSRYINLHVRSHFKAGPVRQEGLLHFMMDMPVTEDIIPLYEQLIHYIKTIRRKERYEK